MSEPKHTPGPWRAIANATTWGVYDRDGRAVAKLGKSIFGAMITANNARLIAAAPDMSDALPDLIECAEILAAQCRTAGKLAHANMWQARADKGRAAIAKVEG